MSHIFGQINIQGNLGYLVFRACNLYVMQDVVVKKVVDDFKRRFVIQISGYNIFRK